MNVVFLSPHFPPGYYLFCVQLRRLGVNVLGLADEPHETLRPELREALTDYYRVENLNDYDQALRALGYFTHRYGRIDRVASHNEHWLELEAYLREHFNIFGKKIEATAELKHKSLMKQKFAGAGVAVAPGRLAHSIEEARQFIYEVGYPVIAKPDKGVGAASTYKLSNDSELETFWREKPHVDYFVEAFVDAPIVTFDGLADRDGKIVFHMSLEYGRNIMEVVAEDDHVYYYTLRDIPEDVIAAGTASLQAFDLREQFFHFEFFRTPDKGLLALELNARPPGWPTTDMFNYANDADVYREWANIVVRNRGEYQWRRPYHVMFIGRKDRFRYRHPHADIVARHGTRLVETIALPGVFSRAMGSHAYLARSPDLGELMEMAAYVHDREA
jgi:biotin carboxylase